MYRRSEQIINITLLNETKNKHSHSLRQYTTAVKVLQFHVLPTTWHHCMHISS